MLTDHPAVSARLFYPRPTDVEPTRFVDVGGVPVAVYEVTPHAGAGTILHFHGNGELASEYFEGMADLFTRTGANVCFVEYRGYGRSGGTPGLAGMMGDGEAVMTALGLDPSRVVAFGRSMGSLYAIELARRRPLAGLVIESGLAGPPLRWGFDAEAAALGISPRQLADELSAVLDHRSKLSAYRGPLLVLHAAGDSLLPPDNAERVHEWAGGIDKRLIVFPHGNHNSILPANAADYLHELTEFIHRTGIARLR